MKKIIIALYILIFLSITISLCNIILSYSLLKIYSKEETNIVKVEILPIETKLNPSISEYDEEHWVQLEFANLLRQRNNQITKEIEEIEKLYSEEDLKYMACIIYCEAGNQCLAGKQAVGIVVSNRVESNRFKNSIKEVIYESGQFSPVASGKIDYAYKLYDKKELPLECIDAAKYALEKNKEIEYEDVLYDMSEYLFFNGYMANASLRIQDHDFK